MKKKLYDVPRKGNRRCERAKALRKDTISLSKLVFGDKSKYLTILKHLIGLPADEYRLNSVLHWV